MANDTAPKTAAQVLAQVRWLENNEELRKMREKGKERHRLHSMLEIPDLSPSLTRGQAVIVNSPRILATSRALMADILSYEQTVKSVASVPPKEKSRAPALANKADDLSKALTLGKDQLNDGDRVNHESIEGMLISPYVVWDLESRDCYDEDGNVQWCWYLNVPAFDTCFFPVQGGPFRPQVFARRYRQLITELEAKYSGQKYGEHAGKKLKRTATKAWDFVAVSDDHAVDGDSQGRSFTDPEQEFLDGEVVVYKDKDWTYHVLVDGDGYANNNTDTGTIVYAERNRVKGGPSVVVFSGATSIIRGERLSPFLWSVYQVVKTLNLIDSIRMTRSYNLKPDALIEHEPDAYNAMIEAGWVRPATTLEMAEGGPNIVDVGGKPHWWQIPPDDDMDKLEDKKINELNDYLQQIQAITSYDVLEKSTASLGVFAAGNVEIQQGPMLDALAWAWTETLGMWLDTISDYDEDWELYAKPGQRYSTAKAGGEFSAGEGLSIGAKDLDGWTWKIYTTIANHTPAQIRVRLEDWARGNELRGRPLEELGEVLGYASTQEWREAMAKDDVLRMSATAWAGFVQAAGRAKLLMKGIDVNALSAFWQPPDATGGGGAGGATNQPMRAPETTGAQGASTPSGGVAA